MTMVADTAESERAMSGHMGCRTCRPSDASAVRRKALCSYPESVDLEISGEMWFWKGPAPWHFITVPEEDSHELDASSAFVSYGWGMIPVTAQIGGTGWRTSLFPKDGRYIVPVKAGVRKAEGLKVGDTVTVRLVVDV
jgi:hypothetical protein